MCSAATGEKVVALHSVSCLDVVGQLTAEVNVCSVLAVEVIVAVTAVGGVVAMTAGKVVIPHSAEEPVGTPATGELVLTCEAPDLVVAQTVELVYAILLKKSQKLLKNIGHS